MRILILEDDPLQQFDITQTVEELGHGVVGPFSSVSEATESCGHSMPDAAFLDFDLGDGEYSTGVADLLMRQHVPFAMTTGHSRRHIPDRFSEAPMLEKPFSAQDVAEAIGGFVRAR